MVTFKLFLSNLSTHRGSIQQELSGKIIKNVLSGRKLPPACTAGEQIYSSCAAQSCVLLTPAPHPGSGHRGATGKLCLTVTFCWLVRPMGYSFSRNFYFYFFLVHAYHRENRLCTSPTTVFFPPHRYTYVKGG